MRNIKFRGKKIDGTEDWVYGFPFKYEYDMFIKCATNDGGFTTHKVDPDTVTEFTGVRVSGVSVYEGDIVRFNNQVGKVVFEKGAFGIGFEDNIDWHKIEKENPILTFVGMGPMTVCYNDHFISFFEIYTMFDSYDEVEVIGNIYDNPELLRGEKE